MTESMLVTLSNAMADAVEMAGKSTVLVDARRRFPASGILISKEFVLTADHVVERDEQIKVVLADGAELGASVAGRDPGSDLAVLKLDRAAGIAAQPSGTQARVGQLVLALGRPTNEGIQASLGTVSALGGPVRTGRGAMLEQYIRTDCISFPGFSGGPLVASDGSVLALNTSGLARGAALAIPTATAWKVGTTLAEHGHIRRGYLGVRSQTVEIDDASRKALKREQESGLLLMGVEKDSPAAAGGLMVGDILVAVKGSQINHHDELFGALTGDVVGKATPIEILRGGEVKTLSITVGER